MTIAMHDRLMPEGSTRAARVAAILRRLVVPAALLAVVIVVMLSLRMVAGWVAEATRIEVVRVEGAFGPLTRSDIEKSLAGLVAGHSLLDVPMQGIAKELDALSWVAAVDVYRIWPHGLVVRVTEKVPVARWNGAGFISHAGDVFQPDNTTVIGALPELRGPEDKASRVMAFYQAANSMLIPLGLGVRRLTLNPQLSWEIVTDNGVRIRVDQQDAASRLRRFLRVYEKHLAKVVDRIDSVDLRYIGGFAVHWTPLSPAENKLSTGANAPGGNNGQTSQH